MRLCISVKIDGAGFIQEEEDYDATNSRVVRAKLPDCYKEDLWRLSANGRQAANCILNYYTNMTSLWGVHQEQLPFARIVALRRTPHRDVICFIIPNKIQNTKGGKKTNYRDFG